MIRVLLVDDDAALGRGTARLLSRHFDVVGVVTDVRSALRRIELDAIDVVVTDYHLIAETGLELFRIARETHPEIRFVLLSGSFDQTVRTTALSEGVHACFDKPVVLAALVAAINAVPLPPAPCSR